MSKEKRHFMFSACYQTQYSTGFCNFGIERDDFPEKKELIQLVKNAEGKEKIVTIMCISELTKEDYNKFYADELKKRNPGINN